MRVSAVPGTSIEESLRIGREVTRALTGLPFVRSVPQRVGRSEQEEDTWGVHYSEFEVDLKPSDGEEAEAAETEIRKVLADVPGVTVSVPVAHCRSAHSSASSLFSALPSATRS